MTTINTIRARLKAVNINAEAVEAITLTKGDIADLNRERMLAGRRSDGSIMPFYSRASVVIFGYPPGPIRLKATGSFQEKVTVNVNSLLFVQDSSDEKSNMLKARYGEAIFGLDKEGKKEYVKELRPVFVKQVRSKLML